MWLSGLELLEVTPEVHFVRKKARKCSFSMHVT